MASLVGEHGSRVQASVIVGLGLSCPSACRIFLGHQACVPYTGRLILNHWTTREMLNLSIFNLNLTEIRSLERGTGFREGTGLARKS